MQHGCICQSMPALKKQPQQSLSESEEVSVRPRQPQWVWGSLIEAEAVSDWLNLWKDDRHWAFNNSCDLKARDCIQNGSSFSLVGSSSMLAVLATILISVLLMNLSFVEWNLSVLKAFTNINWTLLYVIVFLDTTKGMSWVKAPQVQVQNSRSYSMDLWKCDDCRSMDSQSQSWGKERTWTVTRIWLHTTNRLWK